ncbi:MAG: hypothetical protein ACR2FF_04495 [Mycobacteriales bacterium]|nr:MAG: hypothetical protein DLM56_14300 [Pseudonocardiales bacterium]
MTWTWRYEDAGGGAVTDPEPESFATRSDAESWLGEAWPELLDAGVCRVSLYEDDRLRSEPMSLEPPEQ